jgi:tRNA-specific adenosine deaminase 3
VEAGSLFNHSSRPNVSYSIDKEALSIRFTTGRAIREGEELCIFYSHNLWFEVQEEMESSKIKSSQKPNQSAVPTSEDPFGQMMCIESEDNELVELDSLPFEEFRYLDLEESDVSETSKHSHTYLETKYTMKCSSFLVDAWVVDIPDSRYTAKLIE